MMKEERVRVELRLPQYLHNVIRKIAHKQGISVNEFITRSLIEKSKQDIQMITFACHPSGSEIANQLLDDADEMKYMLIELANADPIELAEINEELFNMTDNEKASVKDFLTKLLEFL